jgi:hypothetical protein
VTLQTLASLLSAKPNETETTMMNASPPLQLYWRFPVVNKHYNSYVIAVASTNLSQVFTNCAFIATRPA